MGLTNSICGGKTESIRNMTNIVAAMVDINNP